MVALEELDRGAVAPDHLTSVFVDAGAASAGRAELVRLLQLTKRLRDPGGCPWDAEQTHHSLTRYLLEEAYEVVEALEDLPDARRRTPPLEDELGDLLYQVVFHAVHRARRPASSPWPTSRAASTTSSCAATRTCSATSSPTRPADVVRNWEQIKKEEKGTTSIVDGITPGLPSLLYTHKLFRKAASVGLDPGDARRSPRPHRHRARRACAPDDRRSRGRPRAGARRVGRSSPRAGGIDAESALRGWAASYRRRFEAMEHLEPTPRASTSPSLGPTTRTP